MNAVEKQGGAAEAVWHVPSVFWLDPTDQSIKTAAVIGATCAALAFFGFAQGWMFFACFGLYLSFVTAGQDFMSFQWDSLLVEAGFIALFAVPWNFKLQFLTAVEPHWSARYMFYLLLFKLMFLSGVVKLTSGDETWRDFSALSYHYWTQPLPNPLSPFMYALPMWIHNAGTAFTFFVELIAPFFLFWPRARVWVAGLFIALSAMIFFTGNYTFFNLLTVALCFWLIPDSWWSRLTDSLPWDFTIVPAPLFGQPLVMTVMSALAIFTLIWCTRWMYTDEMNEAVDPALRVAQRFHISNPYGLFATMTVNRPEIVIEGSLDGQTWKEYEFKYKAGNLYRPPPFVAPHQPRLDWQMWFAALMNFRSTHWLQNFMVRLFQGSPEVLALLDGNPFPETPPRYLRARLYQYKFADPEDIIYDGQWWTRTFEREYSPVVEGTTQ